MNNTASERELYWLRVIAEQAEKAVEDWNAGRTPDADLFCIEKHLRELKTVRGERRS